MKTGDELAQGQRSAQFQVSSVDEFKHDLQTLTKGEFCEKYQCDPEKYAELVTALRAGATIAPLSRPPMAPPLPRQDEVKVTVRIPEERKSQYVADALGDNLWVIRVEREHTANFIIPDSAKAKSDIGMVVSVGPDVKRAKVGELVLFDRFAAHGKETELLDEQGVPRLQLLLNDVDVLSRLRKITPKAELASDEEHSAT